MTKLEEYIMVNDLISDAKLRIENFNSVETANLDDLYNLVLVNKRIEKTINKDISPNNIAKLEAVRLRITAILELINENIYEEIEKRKIVDEENEKYNVSMYEIKERKLISFFTKTIIVRSTIIIASIAGICWLFKIFA